VNTIFICGLALDYCVLYTAIDALKLGYKVYILEDCSMAIDPLKVEKKFSAYRNSACLTDRNLEEKRLLLLDSKNILKEY
jgi:nicotinamidase/pyrazinamidase